MAASAQVGIGVNFANIDPSAQLDVSSTNKGFLVPRLTATQRTAISRPAAGLLVYQTEAPVGFYFFSEGKWKLLGEQDLSSKLNVADTSTMLVAYVRSNRFVDSLLSIKTKLNGLLAGKDTVSLSNRINAIGSSSSLLDSLAALRTLTNTKLNTADTAAMLNNRFARDTASLSNRIDAIGNTSSLTDSLNALRALTNLKLNIADTAAMLSNRFARDTVSLSNRINANQFSLGTLARASNANGATIVAGVLSLAPADSANAGLLTASDQVIGGNKTFKEKIKVGNITYPNADSTVGYVLSTNGSGTASWTVPVALGFASVGTISDTASKNGAYLYGGELILSPADSIKSGLLTTGSQYINGAKIFISTDGLLATGSEGMGAIASPGAGTRMMWYPRKNAFRAGNVSSTQWDDANIGVTSTAFGFNTIASGANSLVIGHADTASGFAASAFGQYTKASGSHSFAMGERSKAVGFSSFASGKSSTANNAFSFAMGDGATANGSASLAFGYQSYANGSQTVSLGHQTKAMGEQSTAMGYKTVANGNQSFAIGGVDSAYGDMSVAFGQYTKASGAHAVAMGYQSKASGWQSTAMGQGSISSGATSIAMGLNTIASGDQATAMGHGTTASSWTAVAIGLKTTASGSQATAMGDESKASGSASTAMGLRTTASGNQSTAFGDSTVASGTASLATGVKTKATGYQTTAMGYQTLASGYEAVAMGNTDSAVGTHSVAMGYKTKASGDQSLAIGNLSKVSGNHSVAIGYQSIASSDQTFAVGNQDTASGRQSVAMGLNNKASGNSTVALGYNSKAPSYGETVVGVFNSLYTPISTSLFDSTDRLFVVGNGVDEDHRNDAVVVLKNGNTKVMGTITAGAVTYPNKAGSIGDVLTFSGAGKANWVAPSFGPTSDARLKRNIVSIGSSLSDIMKLAPVTYEKKLSLAATDYPIKENGFIAQDLQKVFPLVVKEGTDQDKLLSVNYVGLIPVLTKAIQEQQEQINTQQKQIEELKKMVEQLMKKN
jgi:hypothetical protein